MEEEDLYVVVSIQFSQACVILSVFFGRDVRALR